MPPSWDQDRAEDPAAVAVARQRCAIPDGEQHRPKWQMALEMIDELIEWGRTPPVLTADAGYGDTTAFRQGLTDRKISYVLAVKGATSAHSADAAPQRPPTPGVDARRPCATATRTSPAGTWPWPPDAPP